MWCHWIQHMFQLWPPFTWERAFGQYVSDVWTCSRIWFGFQDPGLSIKQPVQVHRVSSGDVSHGRAPAFDDLDHSIVIVGIKQRWSLAGNICVWEPQSILSVNLWSAMSGFVFLGLVLRIAFLTASGSNTSITMFHKVSAGIPVNLTPASIEIIYASVLLCRTGVCFL